MAKADYCALGEWGRCTNNNVNKPATKRLSSTKLSTNKEAINLECGTSLRDGLAQSIGIPIFAYTVSRAAADDCLVNLMGAHIGWIKAICCSLFFNIFANGFSADLRWLRVLIFGILRVAASNLE